MSHNRLTVTLDPETLAEAEARRQELGFENLDQLAAEAIRQFVRSGSLEAKHALMQEAAEDPRYLEVLGRVNGEFAPIDGESLPAIGGTYPVGMPEREQIADAGRCHGAYPPGPPPCEGRGSPRTEPITGFRDSYP